jgi:acetyl-CoA carboxylase carboxyl transferase subunit alpha
LEELEMAAAVKFLLDFEKPIARLYEEIEQLKKLALTSEIDLEEEIKKMEEKANSLRKEIFENLSPSQIVTVARHPQRPTTLEYIEKIFDSFLELHGDRFYADDLALIGGLAQLDGESVVVMGHQKGKNTKENLQRNFGMAHPEGYRKALRIMKLAEKFGKPIISFIDTPGAYPGIGAEERGQAEAIARNLRDMSSLKVPIIVVITGEGGSGGALGVGVGNKVIMLQFSIYSVISPEGCAAILWRDPTKAKEAAENLRLTASDLLDLGVIDEIIPEPIGGAHNDPDAIALQIKSSLIKHLKGLGKMSETKIVESRYQKFRKMGEFEEDKVEGKLV